MRQYPTVEFQIASYAINVTLAPEAHDERTAGIRHYPLTPNGGLDGSAIHRQRAARLRPVAQSVSAPTGVRKIDVNTDVRRLRGQDLNSRPPLTNTTPTAKCWRRPSGQTGPNYWKEGMRGGAVSHISFTSSGVRP